MVTAQASSKEVGDLVGEFKGIATSIISDNLNRLPGAYLRPFHQGKGMVGRALTLKTRPGDNLVIHQVLESVKPGDVIVVDGGGDISRAIIGEILVTLAKARGAAGWVVDGAIRDVDAIGKIGLPCYARGINHRGPYKNGPGEANVPVSIDGMVIAPGDIVVGDDDGIVAFSPALAPTLLKACREQEAREAKILQTIRDGTYAGAYGTSVR